MKCLLDTNIFLEIALKQARASEATALFEEGGENRFSISDFSLHSIGLAFFRAKRHDSFDDLLDEMFVQGRISLRSLGPSHLKSVASCARRYGLDFDDAYQYALAEYLGLTIVSFDSDFDRTELGRKTPAQVLSEQQ